jgi:hypothetical protein
MKSATNFRFEFQGGFKDGEVVIEGPKGRYRFLSDRGRVGAQFSEHPPTHDETVQAWLSEKLSHHAPLTLEEMHHFANINEASSHVYEVIEREERPDLTVVRIRFVGESGDKFAAIKAAANSTPVIGSGVAAKLKIEFTSTSEQTDPAWHFVCRSLAHLQASSTFTTSFSTNSCDSSVVHGFSCWFRDEAIARVRIVEAFRQFMPHVKFTITRLQ